MSSFYQPKKDNHISIKYRLGGGQYGNVYLAYDSRNNEEFALKVPKQVTGFINNNGTLEVDQNTHPSSPSWLASIKPATFKPNNNDTLQTIGDYEEDNQGVDPHMNELDTYLDIERWEKLHPQNGSKKVHDNIVQFKGIIEFKKTKCIKMEYMNKGDLAHLATELGDQSGRFTDMEEVLRIAQEIANGMSFLHNDLNRIHRDLKLQNILVNNKLEIKISDFGTTKLLQNTVPKTLQGTPGYIAPEIYAGGVYTKLADVYSYGVVLYIMLMGKLRDVPVSQDLIKNKLKDHLLKDLISKCCSIDPKSRPSFLEIIEDIKLLKQKYATIQIQKQIDQLPQQHKNSKTIPTTKSNNKKMDEQPSYIIMALFAIVVLFSIFVAIK